MSARSAPPELPGYTFLTALGGGGFADVFLYTQQKPRRDVAIKVLRRDHLNAGLLAQFEMEADVMAAVSNHPYIVTIFTADVAPDGRPFIVMEHYPKPHFGLRARGGNMPVAEALRVGVQVSSAVETAHRAGILHRDIKPANVLTDALDRPGLTDFGIAGVVRDDESTAATGVSVAWAPPEALSFDDRDLSREAQMAGDVYSLGATLYSLLAGHAPFWLPGGAQDDISHMTRVRDNAVPPLRRDDVPETLNHLLANAMAKDPSARPRTALDLARALQDVEQELRLAPTQIDVVTTTVAPDADERADGEDRTRRAMPKVVRPEGTAGPVARATSTRPPAVPEGPSTALPHRSPLDDDTVVPRGAAPTTAPVEDAAPPGSPRRTLYLVAGGVVGLLLVIGLVLGATQGSSDATTSTTVDPDRQEANQAFVKTYPPPGDVRVTHDPDSLDLTISWTPPPGAADDPDVLYRLVRTDGDDPEDLETYLSGAFEGVRGPEVTLPGVPVVPGGPCVEIVTVAGDGAMSTTASAPTCATGA